MLELVGGAGRRWIDVFVVVGGGSGGSGNVALGGGGFACNVSGIRIGYGLCLGSGGGGGGVHICDVSVLGIDVQYVQVLGVDGICW